MTTSTVRLNWYTWVTTVETGSTSWEFHAWTKAGSIRKATNYFKEYNNDK